MAHLQAITNNPASSVFQQPTTVSVKIGDKVSNINPTLYYLMRTKKKLKFYKKKLTKFKFKIINILKMDSGIVFPTPENPFDMVFEP